MMADSYYSKPQREEYFVDSGYLQIYEAYHLLKFSNENRSWKKPTMSISDLKKANLWGIGNTFNHKNKEAVAKIIIKNR